MFASRANIGLSRRVSTAFPGASVLSLQSVGAAKEANSMWAWQLGVTYI
jgi:hypothetical protein